MAKMASAIMGKEIRTIVEEALEFYLERKSPRTMEIFNETHGKVGA